MKDSEFQRAERVPMTKQEVRLVVLDRLELSNARCMVDIGAGSGSVAIEAALRHPQLSVVAIEKNPAALALIAENAERLGCRDQLSIIDAYAPCELDVQADAIFIGGSGGNLCELIDWSLERLLPGGRLVMSFILLGNLSSALEHLRRREVTALECSQLQISQLTALGTGEYFKPNNPVFVIACQRAAACPAGSLEVVDDCSL
ncbi:cobalt-precorrin 7 C15-methyltransferase [Aeromonas sp. RU39B]|jgi:cobalt-precorrin-6B (C15)-methyltransferase|uniref:decarboxylating cobalt-precorrin-6B (C(15))-methyltransferase n=1 Tax=Aeromonas sp. RU39B TaxID=1907416 RepID=UPI000955E9A4|nr:decarboxylating cobalt-precorrin-6B (C(15))-methyltransferase [Aeromonas sp. RU39B]SIP98278.1 cobalt-precorrin 7 C15-methyltransferase [Aeromonas sp. RU39B]